MNYYYDGRVVPFVRRLPLTRRVLYWRFHCTLKTFHVIINHIACVNSYCFLWQRNNFWIFDSEGTHCIKLSMTDSLLPLPGRVQRRSSCPPWPAPTVRQTPPHLCRGTNCGTHTPPPSWPQRICSNADSTRDWTTDDIMWLNRPIPVSLGYLQGLIHRFARTYT